MSAERAIVWLLMAVSALIVVPGGWITVEHFREARTFHRWSTESGCRIAHSRFDWCGPERLAEAAETAAEHMQAAVHYARMSATLLVALWGMFFALRWVVSGFRQAPPVRRRLRRIRR